MVDEHMNASDAVLWTIERDPLLRTTITVLTLLDRAPDSAAVRDRVEAMSATIPRLRQVVSEDPLHLAPPRWVDAQDFDIADHFLHLQAPAPGTIEAVLDEVRGLALQPFRRTAPLWETYLIDGMADGRAVFVQKLHHSLTDGVGAVGMASALYDLDPAAAPVVVPSVPSPRPVPNVVVRVAGDAVGLAATVARAGARAAVRAPGAVWRIARAPQRFTHDVATTLGSVAHVVRPVTTVDAPLLAARSDGWDHRMHAVDLAALRDAAHAHGATLNDAFVTAVLGALDRYHERMGAPVPKTLRCTMPVDRRTGGDAEGGNHFVPARFPLPAGMPDPTQRLRAVHERCQRELAEPGLRYSDAVATVFTFLPDRITTRIFADLLEHIDVVVTNVPGFDHVLHLAGARVETIHAFAPLSGAAVNVALFSYCGTCTIGVTTDDAAITDADTLVDCLRESFAEVIELGEHHASV